LNETLLAFQFNQLLEAIGFDKIKTDVEKQPKEFLEVARTMLEQSSERTKRMKVELELQLYREQVTEQKRKMEDAVNTDRSELGLSPEALQKIEEAMARL
jgi:aminopeptidase N